MNIAKLKALIPASFEYAYQDAEGEDQKETVNLQLKRMEFNIAATEEFQNAMNNIHVNAEPAAKMLSQLIANWDVVYNTEEFPPTAENIGSLPLEFVFQMAEAVFSKITPNPQKAETLATSSAQAESLTTSTGA